MKLERKEELSKIINDVGFWNREDKDSILKENNSLTNIIDRVFYVRNKIDSNLMILDSELDDELLSLICEEYEDVNDNVSKLRIETYLSGEFDKNDCILEIHSGAGGTESCDWANMLYRMYQRYCKKNHFEFIEMDKLNGEEVGIKSVTIKNNSSNHCVVDLGNFGGSQYVLPNYEIDTDNNDGFIYENFQRLNTNNFSLDTIVTCADKCSLLDGFYINNKQQYDLKALYQFIKNFQKFPAILNKIDGNWLNINFDNYLLNFDLYSPEQIEKDIYSITTLSNDVTFSEYESIYIRLYDINENYIDLLFLDNGINNVGFFNANNSNITFAPALDTI